MNMNGKKYGKHIFGLVLAILLILLPLYASQYTITTFVRIIYYSFLALSVGILVGQCGMVSLTQTAFFGLTGYVIGLLGVERGWSFMSCGLIGIAAVLVLSLVFGLVIMRTHRIVFMMLTLALGQICWAFARQNTSLLHGWAGIRGIQPPVILGIDLANSANFYWVSLILFGIGLLILWQIVNSPFGLMLNGIRESPRRMTALGYSVFWMRVTIFIIVTLYAGIGGILNAYANGIITPTTIQLSRTIWILLVVILGGANYFWGPVVGTTIAVGLDVIISQITPRYNTVIGIIFLAVVLLTPNGILGLLDEIKRGTRFPKVKIWWQNIAHQNK
jgi:branched-chain amino acid transport system permease protein